MGGIEGREGDGGMGGGELRIEGLLSHWYSVET